jgi:tetratricopeptide (TPR) repeat protein
LLETLSPLKELGAHDQLVDTYRLLGEAALGAGDLVEAADWSEKARTLAESLGTDELSAVQRGELWLFWGTLAFHQADFELARECLNKSSLIFQELKSRLYQGRVSYQSGLMAVAQKDQRSARLRFREAALLFQSVGAKLEEKRAEEAYRR